MLKSLRNNTKTFIWITAGIFILSFVIGSAMSIKDQKSSSIAKIFGRKISRQEYRKFYDIIFFSPRIQNMLRQNTEVPESMLMTTALQYIALYREARSRGIKATDQDVKDEIRRRFSYEGVFNPKLYERHVTMVMRRDLHYYEEILRREIIINKLLDSIQAQAVVTDEEARMAFTIDNQQYRIQYVVIDRKGFENQVPILDETLRAFYEENQSLFAVDEKYDFAFIHFDPNAYLTEAFVTDKQIADYYDNNPDAFIDPETEEPRPLEDVKDEIDGILRLQQARGIAYEKANTVQYRIKELRDVAQGAQEAGVSVQKTGYMTAKELESQFGWAPDFYNKLSELPPKAIRIIQSDIGIFVLILDEKEYAYTPPYPEIAGKVQEKYIEIESMKRAAEKAQTLYESMEAGTLTFEAMFNQEGGVVNEMGPFSAQIGSGNTLFDPLPRFVGFLMEYNEGDVVPPYTVENGTALIRIKEVVPIDEEIFEKNKSIYEERLLGFKRNQILNYEVSLILKDAKIENLLITQDDPFADIEE